MKEVMHEYGKSILAAAAALLLLAILFTGLQAGGRTGLVDILEAKANVEQKDFSEYEDAKQTLRAMERERPVITCQNSALRAGVEVTVEELFCAEDADGSSAELELIRALDMDGTEVATDGSAIQFDRQGTYQVWVRAKDRYCGVTENMFWLPVACR